jgi:proprotein convertase subtilisin/kexin type 5
MVGDSGRCEIITEPGCITWLNKSCSLCSEGFYLFAGHCNQIDSLCSKFNYTSLKCMSCYLGYILINDKCQTIPKANPLYNCAKISPENKCLTCYFGFYLSGGECKIVDPLCRTFDSGSGACTSCYSGYFLLRRQGKCTYVG